MLYNTRIHIKKIVNFSHLLFSKWWSYTNNTIIQVLSIRLHRFSKSTHNTIRYISSKVARNSSEETYTLFNEIKLKTAEVVMLAALHHAGSSGFGSQIKLNKVYISLLPL